MQSKEVYAQFREISSKEGNNDRLRTVNMCLLGSQNIFVSIFTRLYFSFRTTMKTEDFKTQTRATLTQFSERPPDIFSDKVLYHGSIERRSPVAG